MFAADLSAMQTEICILNFNMNFFQVTVMSQTYLRMKFKILQRDIKNRNSISSRYCTKILLIVKMEFN